MDKVLGEFLLQNMNADGKALLFSGRLALDMLEKAIATGIKVLISPGAPTLAAVEAAEAHGLTLLGFVRPDNINIYTNPERITPQHIID
jgi:FdhD protein